MTSHEGNEQLRRECLDAGMDSPHVVIVKESATDRISVSVASRGRPETTDPCLFSVLCGTGPGSRKADLALIVKIPHIQSDMISSPNSICRDLAFG